MSTINTSHYFIPSVREGLTTHIKDVAQGHRAHLSVELSIRARKKGEAAFEPGSISRNVELYGPGDVLGFDKRIVARKDPKPDSGNFEPNYFPAIEFADPDFIWRYTAMAPETNGKLQPWIALIVLISESRGEDIKPEFKEGVRAERSLPRHILVDPKYLPDIDEAWRWGHVHIAGGDELGEQQLLAVLEREPERAVSRLMCARRLAPGTRYTAFVVPTFKLGVMAGLGCAMDSEVDALAPAWGEDGDAIPDCPLFSPDGELRLPYYYRWDFRTSQRGDFEHLVRLLEARKLSGLGVREIDCKKPGFGILGVERPEVTAPEKHYLHMEGALQSLDTRFTCWGRDVCVQVDDTDEIKDIKIEFHDATSVNISWQTVQPAGSTVDYGEDDSYGSHIDDPHLKTEHALNLTTLKPSARYHVKITADRGDGLVNETPDFSFQIPPNDLQQALADLLNKANTEDLDLERSEFSLDIQPTSDIKDISGQVLTMGDQVKVTWHTDEASSSRIDFEWIDIDATNKRSVQDLEFKTDHELILDRLIPDKKYTFKIITTNANGITIETDTGNFTMPPLPVVVPPVYGRWHLGTLRDGKIVDADDQQYWIEHLNLDPRHRSAAGIGAEVIRKNQEPLMAAAWDQLGEIESANDLLRRIQFARDTASWVHKRLGHLEREDYLRVTGAAQRHITTIEETTRARVSAAVYLRARTRITSAPLDPAFSRIAGRRRVIAKRQKRKRPEMPLRRTILQRMSEGTLAAAGAVRAPMGPATVSDISQRLLTKVQPSEGIPTTPFFMSSAPLEMIQRKPGLRFHDRLITAAELNRNLVEYQTFANAHGIPDIDGKTAAVTAAMRSWLEKRIETPKPEKKAAGFIESIQAHLAEQLLPESTFVERAKQRLRQVGKIAQRFDPAVKGDPLEPIMWAPEFDAPMYEPLRDIAHNLMLPGVEKIPQNTVGLLIPNRRFIEAYLCGCNHEFAGELLWRGYPTDQRGSYFRQYWDVSEYIARQDELDDVLNNWLAKKGGINMEAIPHADKLFVLASETDKALDILIQMWLDASDTVNSVDDLTDDQKDIIQEIETNGALAFTRLSEVELNTLTEQVVIAEGLAEKLRDINPIHTWGESALGNNTEDLQDRLILIIRGDLLRRYPNALVYAIDAVVDGNGEIVPALAEYVAQEADIRHRIFPIFRADLQPDLTFFGFPFSEGEARANGDLGKFFVIEESPGEPRFGADTPVQNPDLLTDWNDLSWAHFGFGVTDEDTYWGHYLDPPPDLDLENMSSELRQDWLEASSAERARFTFQKPVRIAIHANQMLPEVDD